MSLAPKWARESAIVGLRISAVAARTAICEAKSLTEEQRKTGIRYIDELEARVERIEAMKD